jgi:rhamnan synthesis protein F
MTTPTYRAGRHDRPPEPRGGPVLRFLKKSYNALVRASRYPALLYRTWSQPPKRIALPDAAITLARHPAAPQIHAVGLAGYDVALPPEFVPVAWPVAFSARPRLLIIHAHYEAEANEIFQYAARLPGAAVVMTSSSLPILQAACRALPAHDLFCLLVPNRGRDVLPFLLVARLLRLAPFRHFVKVHTKRSPHLAEGRQWFIDHIEKLLAPDALAAVAALDPERPILLGSETLRIADYERRNWRWLDALIGPARSPALRFVPGTMFAGTRRLLELTNERDLLQWRFEPERGQLDGCLHHALERYFGYLAVAEGGYCGELPSGGHALDHPPQSKSDVSDLDHC